MGAGEICFAQHGCMPLEPNSFVVSLPTTNPSHANDLLETVGSGGGVGAGARMWRIGSTMPDIRMEYERLVEEMVSRAQKMREAKIPARKIAEFVVAERRGIANQMRWRSGAGTRILFEVRDWKEYGVGGRTFSNMRQRYHPQRLYGENLWNRLIKGATTPNTGISDTALKGAKYLKNGGRVVLFISLASTAYVLLTTPEEDLERVIYEESGSLIGGSLGAGLFTGACFVFGIASAGWGLLACGAVGGIVGGVGGSIAGEKLFYSTQSDFPKSSKSELMQWPSLQLSPPDDVCRIPR